MACPGRRRVLVWVVLVLMSVVVSAGGGGKPMEEDVHAQVHWVVSLISRRLGILTCQAGCGGAGCARVTAVVPAGARSGGEACGTPKGGGHGDRGFEGSGDYEWEGTRTEGWAQATWRHWCGDAGVRCGTCGWRAGIALYVHLEREMSQRQGINEKALWCRSESAEGWVQSACRIHTAGPP